MQLYQRVDIDAGTPVAYAAVYVTRWQPEWGTPTALFREATRAELAAHPTVKARDVRIERLEAVVLLAIAYVKDLIANGDEQWHGDNSSTDAALERLFDGEKDDKILNSLIAALEDDAGDSSQPGEVG